MEGGGAPNVSLPFRLGLLTGTRCGLDQIIGVNRWDYPSPPFRAVSPFSVSLHSVCTVSPCGVSFCGVSRYSVLRGDVSLHVVSLDIVSLCVVKLYIELMVCTVRD